MQYSKSLARVITLLVGATTIAACSEEPAEFDLEGSDGMVDASESNVDLAQLFRPDAAAPSDSAAPIDSATDVDGALAPLDPQFAKAYELMMESCVSCHGEGKTLDLSSPAVAHRELVGVQAEYKACAADGGVAQVRVVANAPQESLLMAKLENRQSCGKQMPSLALLPAEQVEVFRVWIANGAKLH